ncbi:MAG: MmcQ/YjbR family DNA-binding protein [Desulfovibrionaceae bacterium]|nr:MmcQ/YjbR family DNA-binding protein [Desulfovibrionaceae bacterium]
MFEENFFHKKKSNENKLLNYGFIKKDDTYQYDVSILENQFLFSVYIYTNGKISTKMIERSTNEEYSLYKVTASAGFFVGKVRAACEAVLTDISQKCFDPDIFQSEQTLEIIDYVRKKYGDELEFLWDKFPDNAIWRRKDNQKWYGLLLTISKEKLGLKSREMAEILDLRLNAELMADTVDHKKYFPGWHMNKKSWYTIILDRSVSTEEICQRMDQSYRLAAK